jgi:hypothetical protein
LICLKCGQENLPEAKFCENCKVHLPKFSNEEKTRYPKAYERYTAIKNAGDKVKVGDWTVDEFADFLEKISANLAKIEQEIHEIEIPEESMEDFMEELEAGFSGIELYNQGITEMMLFVEDMDAEHLEQGLNKVTEGNEKINEAILINRNNRKQIEDIYPFTSTFL